MPKPFIQSDSDGKKQQPHTQEKRAPFRPYILNQYPSKNGTYRLGSLQHEFVNPKILPILHTFGEAGMPPFQFRKALPPDRRGH
jgi:hypothetical protein